MSPANPETPSALGGFGEVGFLSDQFADWTAQHVRNFAPQYALCFSLNRHFQRWLLALEVKEFNDRGELDPQPLMVACLAARGLSHFQATLLLAQRGMMPEARVVTRSLLEVTFRLAAIAQHAEIAREYILEDNRLRKDLMERLDKLSANGRGSFTVAERDAARAAIDAALDEYGGKKYSVYWYAEQAGMADFYNSAYALLSVTVHAQARDLQHYAETDESGRITSLILKPNDDGASIVLMAVQECLLVILEQAQSVFPNSVVAEQTARLRSEFVAVTTPLAERSAARSVK
jgi:hypothetical protein